MLKPFFCVVVYAGLTLAAPHTNIVQRALVVNTNVLPTKGGHLNSPWQFQGCYDDSINVRALNAAWWFDDMITDESCVSFCNEQGYNVAGTEYSTQCFCGTSTNSLLPQSPTDCNMACGGNSSKACGGPNRLSVYLASTPGPVTNAGDGVLTVYVNCWVDSVSSRALPWAAYVPGGSSSMTVAKCSASCREKGNDYAGVEYAGECFCGQSASDMMVATGTPDLSGCNMPCKGNVSEYCGGANRLNVYYLPPVSEPSTYTNTSAAPSTLASSTIMSSTASSTTTPSMASSIVSSLTTSLIIPPSDIASTTTSLIVPPSTTPSASSHDIVTNGGFEDITAAPIDNTTIIANSYGLAYNWTITPNGALSTGNLHSISGANTPLAHTGSRAFMIIPFPNEPSNMTRSVCVAQTAYHPSAGIYTISVYIGRGNYTGNAESDMTNLLTYEVLVDGNQIAQGDVCMPSGTEPGLCDVRNVLGVLGYKLYTFQVQLPASAVGDHTLSICGVYEGSDPEESDVLVIDDVAIIAP